MYPPLILGTIVFALNFSEVINHGLNSKKLIVQLWLNDEEVTSSFDVEKSMVFLQTLGGVPVLIYWSLRGPKHHLVRVNFPRRVKKCT